MDPELSIVRPCHKKHLEDDYVVEQPAANPISNGVESGPAESAPIAPTPTARRGAVRRAGARAKPRARLRDN